MPRADAVISDETASTAEVLAVVAAAEPEPAPAADSGKALVVVGGGKIPARSSRLVIVAERRTSKTEESGEVTMTATQTYASGADVYLRTADDVTFPPGGEVVTLGVEAIQAGFSGFARRPPALNVGPAHPAFAAANLAWQRGATEIEIQGLTKAEQEQLRPWFDELSTHRTDPAQVSVSFT